MTGDRAPAAPPPEPVTPDPWRALSALTPARLALGRAGSGLPTREVLALALAHARARDAVHDTFDRAGVAKALAALGLVAIEVDSAAPDREAYLRRPDFGRTLSAGSRDLLAAQATPPSDVVIVVADGLSATAVNQHAVALVADLLPRLRASGARVGTACVARQGRVALGDEIGALLQARFCIMLIGERPGLSASDSLGAYLTDGPRPGRSDAERNCVSNIRPGGLLPARAAGKIAWLVERAFALSLTGIALKDDSDHALPPPETGRLGES